MVNGRRAACARARALWLCLWLMVRFWLGLLARLIGLMKIAIFAPPTHTFTFTFPESPDPERQVSFAAWQSSFRAAAPPCRVCSLALLAACGQRASAVQPIEHGSH